MSKPILSFCTVVMNRLHHIKETLPENLAENKSDAIQFVILDYNSSDGLEEYIKSNFGEAIKTGKLVYYKNKTAVYFNLSHSKNMAFRLATGDILCNIDADNYAGPSFGEYIIDLFESHPGIFLTGLKNTYNIPDANGKLCVRREDFMSITGFDENFEGHGFEDYDIVNRLTMHGLKPVILNQKRFLKAITHDDVERFQKERSFRNLHAVYLSYIDHSTTRLLFLFSNGSFRSGTIINNYTVYTQEAFAFSGPGGTSYQFDLKEKNWTEGKWDLIEDNLTLSTDTNTITYKKSSADTQDSLVHLDQMYYRVTSESMISEAICFLIQLTNRIRMLNNLSTMNITSNQFFGQGMVYKNFENHAII